jgi:hypothetical protein
MWLNLADYRRNSFRAVLEAFNDWQMKSHKLFPAAQAAWRTAGLIMASELQQKIAKCLTNADECVWLLRDAMNVSR